MDVMMTGPGVRFRACLYVLLLSGSVLWGGCTASQEGPSATDRQRQTASPQAQNFLLKAQEAYQRGIYNAALTFADSAARYAPRLADIQFLRAKVYTQLKQLDRANGIYRKVLEMDPAYQGARLNMGINRLRQGEVRDGLNWFMEARERHSTSSVWLEMGRAYNKLGEADSARMAYERAIELDSTNATAYMWLGQLHEELGNMEKALGYSRRGLKLQPDNLNYQYIIGSQLSRLGRSEEALSHLKPVAEQWPWHHGAQYNTGQTLMHLGQEEKANRYLTQADSAQSMQHRVEKAAGAVEKNPGDAMKWVEMGDVLREVGRTDRAVDSYQVAASLRPRNLGLQTNLASIVASSGQYEEAAGRYRAILRVDSTLPDVWLNLGVVYARMDQMERARRAWKKALAHEPGHRKARAYLAQLDG